MYTAAWRPVVYTELDEQHSTELFLIAGDDRAGHTASPTKQAYAI
jgi:hypothetical protein